jgi:glucose-1-phosphate thymidylyltransferase
MKGIILAGGLGSRLRPITLGLSKQLLPVFDKPMIYYPISTLISAEVREILIITTPHEQSLFQRLLGDGKKFGVKFSYAKQLEPKGIAEAFLIGEKFIGQDSVALILGDNIFYGFDFKQISANLKGDFGGHIFAYQVENPSAYGVIKFDSHGVAESIEEKPERPQSKFAVPGLYFYDRSVIELAKSLSPSQRNELEISDINLEYLKRASLKVTLLPEGTAWLDTGTVESLAEAAEFVKAIQNRQGLIVGSPEFASWKNGWLSENDLKQSAEQMLSTAYGRYLNSLVNSKKE